MQNISYGEFNKINSINFTSEYGKLKNIKLEGSTSQATRSGKNKLPYNYYDGNSKTVNGITFTVNQDRSITANGTATANATFGMVDINSYAITAGSYKLVGENSEYTKAAIRGSYKKADGTIKYITSDSSFTIPEGATNVYIYVVILQGETVNNVTFYPMLLNSTETDLTFEAGGASPSSDYPSPIKNIEGKNKFDINQEKEIFGIMLYKYSYYLKPNTKYTISSNCPASTTANIYVNSNSSKSAVYINKNQTIQSDENGYFYILVRFKADASDNSTFNLYEKVLNGTYYIQLEEGTVATPYFPYNSLEIKDVGENLFDCANSKIIYNNAITLYERLTNGLKIISNGGQYNMLYFLVDTVENLKGKTLTLSSDILFSKEKQYVDFGLYYTDFNGGNRKKIVANPNITSEGKYQVTGQVEEGENRYYVCIGLRPNMDSNFAKGDYTIYDNLQVEIGETATPYKPYQEQKVDFPLSEGQKLYEGSYLASDGIHHKRKQIVLKGTENWAGYAEKTNTVSVYLIMSDLVETQNSNILSNRFQKVGYEQDIEGIVATPYVTKLITIKINKSRLTEASLVGIKNWLETQYSNGTPVIVEYELATEEIVPYTEAQQEAWDKIENFPIFIGQNNLTSTALLSAIYIKKITTDTKVDYNLYNEDYIKIATKNNIHPKFKIQMLDEYENVIDEITGDISRDNSGSISNNYQQGVRRSVSLTFIDTEGKFLPDSNSNLIWANKKFKLFSGLLDTDTNEIFWFSEGIYYFSNVSSSRNGADKLTTVNGVDKFGKFGSELGYNQLESTYLIPAGTKIYDAIKGILNIDIGNGYPIDPIEPVLDPLYIDEVCPYDISKSPSSYLSEMLIELADIIGCDIYYDADGRLHVDSGTIDSSYSNKPSIWDFSDVLPEYMNPSITTNFAEFINTVKVVGNNTNDKTYEYTAVNNNPESPTRVDLIGTKSTYIESASVYNTDRAKDYAEYKLNMFSILQLAVTFSCTFLPHLDVNKVITITDSYYKYEKQRFVIQSITLPLSYDGVMSISACNVASLPYYEGGN